jgi:hypothetical protein
LKSGSARQDGEVIADAVFDTALRKAIAQIVRAQVDIGVVNDGEFGKSISWSRHVLERVRGFERRGRDRNDRSFARSTYGKDRRDFADFCKGYAKGGPPPAALLPPEQFFRLNRSR